MDDPTEPDLAEVSEVEDVAEGTTEELDTAEPETEAEEGDEDSEAEVAEFVELEINGKMHRIPAELRDEFMLRADYTRKTQETAELRKALETRITEASSASEEEVGARAQIVAIDAALQQYENVDWEALEAQSPMEAARHFRQFMMLRDSRGAAEQELKDATGRREAQAQRYNAERWQQSMAELGKAIPDWGEAKAVTLKDFAHTQFGFSEAEFRDALHDPRAIKMLNVAYAALKSPNKPAPAPPAPKPAAKVKGASIPKAGLDDRLSADEWARRRNAQVANRR